MRALLLLFVFGAVTAEAQYVSIVTVPASPVAGSPFVVRITMACCCAPTAFAVNGTNIDITITGSGLCPATPPILVQDITVGPVPAGTYTIRLVNLSSPTPVATAPVQVSANIPALDPRVVAMLAMTLIALAMLRLRVR